MTPVLTYSQFCELAASHPLTGLDNSPYVGNTDEEPPSADWLGYVPVMWLDEDTGSYDVVYDVDECDDWKEVGPFRATFKQEAEALVRAVYGPHAEVDPLDSDTDESVSSVTGDAILAELARQGVVQF